MGKLYGSSCYLAGPVDRDPRAIDWRKSITKDLLKPLGIKVHNPLVKPLGVMCDNAYVDPSLYYAALDGNGDMTIEEVFEAMDDVRNLCISQLNASDFVICHLPKISTFGTIVELDRADLINKPVLFHCPDGVSTWAISQFSDPSNWNLIFSNTWEELSDLIHEIDKGGVEIDPLKWLFLGDK